MVQLKAEPSDKESKEDKEEVEEEEEDEDEEFEDEEAAEEDEDDLDELVMDEDDEDDDEDLDEDDDFEAGDDEVLYGEDDLDDGFFTTDEDGEPLEAVCKARFLKGSPWKFRRVLWQIRGRTYREALMLLEFMPWRACRPTLCALQSAAANAQNQFNMDKARLYVYSCKADRGPYSKRMRPMSKGQPHQYRRRSTHLEIVVREMSDSEMMKNNEFAWEPEQTWHDHFEEKSSAGHSAGLMLDPLKRIHVMLLRNQAVFPFTSDFNMLKEESSFCGSPDAPCMQHLPTFTANINHSYGSTFIIGTSATKQTIHGAYGEPQLEITGLTADCYAAASAVGAGCIPGNLTGLLHLRREHLLPEGNGGLGAS